MNLHNTRALMVTILAMALLAVLATYGPTAANHYNNTDKPPATIEPETIPLWGPTWSSSSVTIAVEAGKGVTPGAIDEVLQAITDWNHAIATMPGAPPAFLNLIPDTTGAQIVVRPKGGGGTVQGQALCQTDANGFFTTCKVNVSGKAFGSPNPGDAVRSIALQEIGHALGLLHAEGAAAPQDVMYGTLQNPPNTRISSCDLDAWAAVMAWLLDGLPPALPSVGGVSCGTPAGGTGGLPVTVAVETDKPVYANRETVGIDVTVTDSVSAPVAGAVVTLTLTTANGGTLAASATTNDSGQARFTYRVNAGRDGSGTYAIGAQACKGGTCASGGGSFEVQ